eukprot:Rmarinus@m.2057
MVAHAPGFRITLVCAYSLVCIAVCIHIFRTIVARHNLFSQHIMFHLHAAILSLFRLLYYACDTDPWPSSAKLVVFWLPENIELSMFVVLACYYLSTLHKHLWEDHFLHITTLYSVVSVGLLVGMVGWVGVLCAHGNVYDSEAFRRSITVDAQGCMMGVAYLVLAVLLFAFIFQFLSIKRQGHRAKIQTPFQNQGVTTSIIALTGLAAVVVFTRAVFNFVAMVYADVREIFDYYGQQKHDVNLLLFLLLLVWEVIPIVGVLVFFRRIPTAAREEASNVFNSRFSLPLRPTAQAYNVVSLPNVDLPLYFGPDLATPSPMESTHNLFNNPHRYDSDDGDDGDIGSSVMNPLLPRTMYAPIR